MLRRVGITSFRISLAIQGALFVAFFCLLALAFPHNADAATIYWNTDQDGDWSVASNWTGGVVPGASDDVVIDRPGANPTVTISSGNRTVLSVTAADNLSITGGSLTVSATSVVSGSFTISSGALLRVTGAQATFDATGATTINNARFEVTGGAVVQFPNATQYVTTGIQGTIVQVRDAGSRLDLSGVTQLATGWYHNSASTEGVFEARDGGVLDFSGVTTLTTPTADGNDSTRFRTRTGGQILWTSFQSVNGRAIFFDFDAATFTLPALTQIAESTTFLLVSGQTLTLPLLTQSNGLHLAIPAGAVVNAPNLTVYTGANLSLDGSAQFNSGLLTNINNTSFLISGGNVFSRVVATSYTTTGRLGTIVQVRDAGSRLDLSSVTQLATGWYHNSASTEGVFEARDGGVLDFSGVTTLTTPTADGNDSTRFRTRTGGQILWTSFQSVNGRAIFFDFDAATFTLPALTQIAEATTFLLVSGQTLNLPLLTQSNGLYLTIPAGAVVNAPNLTVYTGANLSLDGSALFNSGMLTDITGARFNLSGGNVFNRIVATSYSTVNSGTGTFVRVQGTGTRLEMPSVTHLSVGMGHWFFSYSQLFEALDGGVVDWSNVTSLTAPTTDGDDPSTFRVRNGGQILLTALQSTSGQAIIFDSDETNVAFAALTSLAGVTLRYPNAVSLSLPSITQMSTSAMTVPSGQVVNLPQLVQTTGSQFVVEVGGVVNLPNLTVVANSTLDLRGTAQFNCGMLTNITGTRFYLSGGNVFNRVSATSYSTVNSGTGTFVRVQGAGSRLEMPSVTQLSVGMGHWFYSYSQLFEALDGGVVDWPSVVSLTTPTTDGNDYTTFGVSTTGTILLGALPQIEATAIRFSVSSAGSIDLSSIITLLQGPFSVLADGVGSVIDLSALCTYVNTTFTETSGGEILHESIPQSEKLNTAIFGTRSIGQTSACTGPQCSTSSLFSIFPSGRCLSAAGVVQRSGAQLDIDGLAASPAFGVVGFDLIHSSTSGNITGSRLVSLNIDTAAATNIGTTVHSGRVIRAAAFSGDNLFAIDIANNEFLQIVPAQGTITGTPVALSLNGQPYDIGDRADLAVDRAGTFIVSDENELFTLDPQTGVLTAYYTDTQPIQGSVLPDFSGLAFGADATTVSFELFQLITGVSDRITKLTESFTRTLVAPAIPGPASFDGIHGDLASVSTVDTQAPGPVTITINPNGDGTYVDLDWTSYNEALNGNDINRYLVFTSTSNFSNINQATQAGNTPQGVKTYRLSNLQRNQQIFVAVVAVDNVSNVNPAVTAVATTPIDVVPPQEVGVVTTQSATNQVNLSWQPSPSTDLQFYRVYRDNLNVSGNLSAATTAFPVTGLSPATGYSIRITAVDQSNNESPGRTLNIATLLSNPTGLSATALNGGAGLSWNAVTPANLVGNYRVYAETTNFTDITGKTVRRTVAGNVTSTQLAGLQNNTTYYVAVTAVNISGGESPLVQTVQVTPQADTVGPTLTLPLLGGTALTSGRIVTGDAPVQVTGTDPSGMSRVDFFIQNGTTRTLIGQSAGSGPNFTAFWNLTNYPDGPYTVVMEGYDTVNNMSSLSVPVTVDYAPPPAPVITSPVNNFVTNLTSVQVQGNAPGATQVVLSRNGTPVTGNLTVSSSGAFSALVQLDSGANNFTAVSTGRGGASPASAPVTVTLDESVPDAPTGITATSLEDGEVRLTWNAVASTTPIRYRVYRSTASFSSTSQATLVTPAPLTATNFIDLPNSDGQYFYRVVALNQANVAGAPSAQVVGTSDRLGPTVTQIQYSSTGEVDPITGRMAPGVVTVTLDLTEALSFAPFFSIAPDGGVPIPVPLAQSTSPTRYTGIFTITPETLSGTAYAIFSGRDQVGNRGTNIQQGQSILIDTDGPAITALTLQPSSPIQTSSTSPVVVTVQADLNEDPAPNTTPTINFVLSAPGRQPVPISNLAPVGGNRRIWSGSFTLPNDAGAPEPETLSFELDTTDDLGNAGTTVQAQNTFQVYQGNLPPLGVPQGLTARARPGGAVELEWSAVPDAAGYQLYRQDPGSTQLQPLGSMVSTTFFTDPTPVDGQYLYAVASIRQVGALQALSAQSSTVLVTSDRVPPSEPQTLALQMTGQGVLASWQEPIGGAATHGPLKYALYRANVPPSTPIQTAGLTPIISNIIGLLAVDAAPSETEHAYAVVALDEAGNASIPSNTEYLNFALLPVGSLEISLTEGQYPQISWSYTGSAAAGFMLELVEGPSATVLQQSPSLTYTDQAYAGGERLYRVTALDSGSAQSAQRSLLLPNVEVEHPANLAIMRGVMNRLSYTVRNNGSSAVVGARLKVELDGRVHFSEPFDIQPQQPALVPVVVGGYEDLGATEALTTTLEITPNAGELVEIISTRQAAVTNSSLLVTLETEQFTLGATGRIRLSLTNTSAVTTEIVTARQNGALPSDEIEFRLTDGDTNVYGVVPLHQFTGSSVVTLPNGKTVARILPNETFVSDWMTLPVPANAPVSALVSVSIDTFHYKLGTPEHVAIQGRGTTRTVLLVTPPYYGEVLSITPSASYSTPIVITGRALDSTTNLASAFQTLDLILTNGGFERREPVTTDSNGVFTFQVEPSQFQAGVYQVSAVYPGTLDRPNHGSFTINGVTLSNTVFNAHVSKNYVASFDVTVSTAPGTDLTGVQLRYVAADQPGQQLIQGLVVTPPAAVNISGGGSHRFTVQFAGQSSAPNQGQFVLGLVSNETGSTPINTVTVNFLFSPAAPAISVSPTTVETGVTYGTVTSTSVVIRNVGLAPLLDAQVELLRADLNPAPSWFYTSSVLNFPQIDINETRQIDLFFSPTTSVSEGFHNFVLRITAPGQQPRIVPIAVAVSQSGQGSLVVHVSDIYTGTLNAQSQLVLGLEGASVRVESEAFNQIVQSGTTDSFGEVLIQGLTPGSYRVRVSAPGHRDEMTLVNVYPSTTTPKEVFLINNVVTVEWSVQEITIEDYYQINLNAIFQTNVPVAVAVLEPAGIQLPSLQNGQVFNGELTLTNYGLIPATNLQAYLPASDDQAQFEFFGTLPSQLLPQQRIFIPYRITALRDFDPGSGSSASGGGGTCAYTKRYCVDSRSTCANGAVVPGSTCAHWLHTRNCHVSSGPPPGSITGGLGGSGSGGGGSPYIPGGNPLPNLACVPGTNCSGEAAAPTM